MSRKFDSPVTLVVRRSRLLGALIGLCYGGALILAFTLPFPFWIDTAIAAVLAWRGIADFRTQAWRSGNRSIVAVTLDDAGHHALRRHGDATDREFRVLTRFIDPRLTILTVRSENRKRREAILVARDAVDGEEFRRWRARLRLQTSAE